MQTNGPLTRSQALIRIPAGVLALGTAVAVLSFGSKAIAQSQSVDFRQESACQTLTTTSMGGPAPKSPALLVWRWLGASNVEFAYRETVVLINAYHQRVPPARPLGFTRDDIKKANIILVGHAHGDHIADVPYVAQRTGATVIGAPITAANLNEMGLPRTQIVSVTGRGGEVQQFSGFTVEALLARHLDATGGPLFRATTDAYRSIMGAAGLARTPAQMEQARLTTQGSVDPRILDEGTISYLITFDGGYRVLFRDAAGSDGAGPGTEVERKTLQRIGGRVNLAVIGYSTYVPPVLIPQSLLLLRLFKPDVYMPTHHDDIGGQRLVTPVEPLFMAIRDELPDTRPISPLYRTPICIDTQSKEVFVGR